MVGGLKLITAPTVEPLSILDLRDHLRLPSGGSEDAMLARWLTSARTLVEQATGRALITQTWEYVLDRWPAGGVLEVPLPPLVSVTSITTYTSRHVAATMPTADYWVDSWNQPGRVALNDGAAWPTDLRAIAGIVIRYQCGYGASGDAVPTPLRDAILATVAARWRWRGDDDPIQLEALPPGVLAALQAGGYVVMRQDRFA